jgi:hypothetical protein
MAPTPVSPVQKPSVIMSIKNIEKKWYSADERAGPYDGHPEHARDWNLESFGNTDYGEPLCAPCDGTVVFSGDVGGLHGIVIVFVAVVDGELTCWHWKHLSRSDVRLWQQVKQGELVGAIGNAGGQYSAHLHEEIVVGTITGSMQDWRDSAFDYQDPAAWYIAHGVPASQVNRMVKYDGA